MSNPMRDWVEGFAETKGSQAAFPWRDLQSAYSAGYRAAIPAIRWVHKVREGVCGDKWESDDIYLGGWGIGSVHKPEHSKSWVFQCWISDGCDRGETKEECMKMAEQCCQNILDSLYVKEEEGK